MKKWSVWRPQKPMSIGRSRDLKPAPIAERTVKNRKIKIWLNKLLLKQE